MRHRIKTKQLNRDTKSRKALFKNLVRSLVEHGSIVTTETKAKEVKRLADKIIGRAKTDSVETRRNLHKFFGRRDVVNTLVDKIAPEFKNRVSGFTRISKVGIRRGDNALLTSLSLVKLPEEMGTLKSPKVEKPKSQKEKTKEVPKKSTPKKVTKVKKQTNKETPKK
jgi:large subunit ribosomal protein L17